MRWRRCRAVVVLAVVLECYDLRDARGLWQGVAVVSEDEDYEQMGKLVKTAGIRPE
jgi:hypothetical protein